MICWNIYSAPENWEKYTFPLFCPLSNKRILAGLRPRWSPHLTTETEDSKPWNLFAGNGGPVHFEHKPKFNEGSYQRLVTVAHQLTRRSRPHRSATLGINGGTCTKIGRPFVSTVLDNMPNGWSSSHQPFAKSTPE